MDLDGPRARRRRVVRCSESLLPEPLTAVADVGWRGARSRSSRERRTAVGLAVVTRERRCLRRRGARRARGPRSSLGGQPFGAPPQLRASHSASTERAKAVRDGSAEAARDPARGPRAPPVCAPRNAGSSGSAAERGPIANGEANAWSRCVDPTRGEANAWSRCADPTRGRCALLLRARKEQPLRRLHRFVRPRQRQHVSFLQVLLRRRDHAADIPSRHHQHRRPRQPA
jgi:hypothetical protein